MPDKRRGHPRRSPIWPRLGAKQDARRSDQITVGDQGAEVGQDRAIVKRALDQDMAFQIDQAGRHRVVLARAGTTNRDVVARPDAGKMD